MNKTTSYNQDRCKWPNSFSPDIQDDGSEMIHYDDPDFPIFCRRNQNPANSCFPGMAIHWHDDIEFIYVTKGRTSYQLNGKTVSMSAGQGIFVNSRQLHLIISEDSDCDLDCIIFHPMILCSSKLIEEKYVIPVISNDAVPYLLLSQEVSWQQDVLLSLGTLYDLSIKENQELNMVSVVCELWHKIYENLNIQHPQQCRPQGSLRTVKQMIEYIHSNYRDNISLEDICQSGNVGKTGCTRLFDQYTNMTPMLYVRNYRLSKSMELLCDPDLTIAQIAFEVGFSGASYYAETFKKKIGSTPLEYRKMRQGIS